MIFTESNLKFNFLGKNWSSLLKFDETRDYQNAQQSIPGTKGVDFIGTNNNRSLVLVEVKNFRGHRIKNKPKTEKGEAPLWLEVARKMRDSFSVIIAGARNSTNDKAAWKNHLELISSNKKSIHFVLWLEQDMPPANYVAQKKWEQNENHRRRDLKRSLRWLSTKVDIASTDNNPFPVSLSVSYI